MRSVPIGLAALLLVTLGSCATRPAPAPAPPRPVSPPVVRPAPEPQPPPSADWPDAPLSPGEWTYDDLGSASSASFGPPGRPGFTIRCEPGRQVSLARTGAAASAVLTIRTSTAVRSLPARAAAGALVAALPSADPFLDSIVFSRGRFAVEAAGLPVLIVPAWPEPARVVEDCRS